MQPRGASIIDRARAEGRTVLSERESKAFLDAYGIPTVKEISVVDEADCRARLKELQLPVAVKIDSPDILHKTEVGGVIVGCRSEADVLRARTEILESVKRHKPEARVSGVLLQEMVVGGTECFVGIHTDDQFGPIVAFGLGGVWVEVLDDVSLRAPPLNLAIAHDMVSDTIAGRVLKGVRGRPPADREAVVKTLIAVSEMASDWRGVLKELDINPLIVLPGGVRAVDGLVILSGPEGG